MVRKYLTIYIFLILLFAFIIRLLVMEYSAASVHPDEIFQSIEPAHKLAFGYGMMAWEWTEGIRSWFLPFIYMVILKISNLSGVNDSIYLAGVIYLFNIFLSLITVYSMFIIGKEAGGIKAGIISALSGATCPLITVYAHRPLSESLSLNFIMLSMALIYRKMPGRLLIITAGISLGIAFVIRFPSGVFFIPILIFLYIKGDRISITWFIISSGLVLLCSGIVDFFTWGSLFHAPVEYFRFNILENKSSAWFGSEPVYWYLKILLVREHILEQLLLFIFLVFFIAGASRSIFCLSVFIFYLLCFSVISHKEFRFIIPLFPFVLILISLGIDRLMVFKSEKAGRFFTIFTVMVMLLFFLFVTPYTIKKAEDPRRGLFDAVNFTGNQQDARGVIICTDWCDTGGYFYLHKLIPVAFPPSKNIGTLFSSGCLMPFGSNFYVRIESFNYAIINRPLQEYMFSKHGWSKVRVFNGVAVYKINRLNDEW